MLWEFKEVGDHWSGDSSKSTWFLTDGWASYWRREWGGCVSKDLDTCLLSSFLTRLLSTYYMLNSGVVKRKSKIESCPLRAYRCGKAGHTKKWREIREYSGASEVCVPREFVKASQESWHLDVQSEEVRKERPGGMKAGIKGRELRLLRCVAVSLWGFCVLRSVIDVSFWGNQRRWWGLHFSQAKLSNPNCLSAFFLNFSPLPMLPEAGLLLALIKLRTL